jgi:SRSO17 transposase
VTYYITSLRRDKADATRLLHLTRHRWWIESRFWILDNILGSDSSRLRTGKAAHALTVIQNFAMNAAKRLKQSTIAFIQENAAKTFLLLSRLRIRAF